MIANSNNNIWLILFGVLRQTIAASEFGFDVDTKGLGILKKIRGFFRKCDRDTQCHEFEIQNIL